MGLVIPLQREVGITGTTCPIGTLLFRSIRNEKLGGSGKVLQ